MAERLFDIFSGRSPGDKGVLWLDAVEGLEKSMRADE
jgi:hypothetical protein